MELLIYSSCVLLVLILLWLLWQYQQLKKRLHSERDELKFFKKEKEYADEAMLLLSGDYTVIYANQAAKKIFSLDDNYEASRIGKKIQLQIASGMHEEFFHVLGTYSKSHEGSFTLENVFLYISGREHKVNIFMDKSALDINGTMTCVIDLKPETKEIENTVTEKEGTTDFLTGLPSQFQALSDINTLVIESKKKSESFGVFLMGIDHFTDIQTSLGIGYTNKVLKRLAQYWIEHPYENVTVYRMDADKFLYVVHGLDEDESSKKIAKDIMVSIGNIFRDNNDVRLTSSIGIVLYPRDGENATKLIDNAYRVLYQAQEESESNIKIYSNESAIVKVDDIHMNEEIKQGLIKSEFLLYYQPIFDIEGTQIIGAEALLRWKHPNHGLISADKFLPIAEKTGLIVDLGEYVFSEAIKQRERCSPHVKDDFKITINMSLKEMQVEQLIPRLEMLFEKYKVQTDMINLDVSENDVVAHINKTANDFKLFKDLGLSLSLEHFGAGYTSFKYLNLLPIDMIKIDRSLIFDLTLNLQHQTTVKAMIELAHTFGYKVVAEGVETSEESSILEKLDCDYAQGYLYSRPLPAKEFEALLK